MHQTWPLLRLLAIVASTSQDVQTLRQSVLQILNSVQQMPRVKTHQNAALLREEQALLVWGKTTNEVADKLMELEDQIAGAMALDGIQQKEQPLKAAPAPRGFNYSTPISTYLALAGTMAIIMLMVRLHFSSASL